MVLHLDAARPLALALLLLLAWPAWADDDAQSANPDWFPGAFTASVDFATDYPFRGISQTNEYGAIQGNIDYGVDFNDYVSLYLGGWGSNVDFGDGDNAQAEMDIYGGLSGTIGKFSWDVGTIYYAYPGADNNLHYNYWELGPTFGYDFGVASVSAGLLWSPEFFARSGDAYWIHGGVEVPVPESALPNWLGISVSGNLGQQAIDKDQVFGVPDYLTWDLGATFSAFGLDFDIRYYDTSISKNGCFGGGEGVRDLCQARAVAMFSKSF